MVNNLIGPILNHVWNVPMHVVLQNFRYIINTTASHQSGRYCCSPPSSKEVRGQSSDLFFQLGKWQLRSRLLRWRVHFRVSEHGRRLRLLHSTFARALENIVLSLKNGPFLASFSLFSSLQYSWQKTVLNIKFADDWIWISDLWCWKRRLYRLSHSIVISLP